jgi:hypothetical protein
MDRVGFVFCTAAAQRLRRVAQSKKREEVREAKKVSLPL